MQIRTALEVVAARELLQCLRLAVFEHFEVVAGEVGEKLSLTVADRRRKADQLGSGSERGLLG